MSSLPEAASGPERPSPDDDPFGDWLAERGPHTPALRVGFSFLALVAGWIAAIATTLALEAGMSTPRWADVLLFDLIIGAVALAAWAVSVVPLAIYGDHGSAFFRPALAPVIGAVCGVALLLAAVWIMGTPPARFLGGDPAATWYFVAPAAVLGGTCWWIYTLWAAWAGTVTGPPPS